MTASINTNTASGYALNRLNSADSALQTTRKQIGTGYKVADALDNGAVFAIAQGLRADLGSITSSNQELANARGVTQVAAAATQSVSDTLGDYKAVVTRLSSGSLSANERQQLQTQLGQLGQQIGSAINGASYNGVNILSSGANGTSVVANNNGGQVSIAGNDLVAGVVNQLTPVTSQAQAQSLLTGGLATAISNAGTALNQIASDDSRLKSQSSFNSQLSDAINTGIGSAVDADLTKAAALQQAQQVGQQLATQSASIANAAPQALLSLYNH